MLNQSGVTTKFYANHEYNKGIPLFWQEDKRNIKHDEHSLLRASKRYPDYHSNKRIICDYYFLYWDIISTEPKAEMFPSKDIWLCAVSAAMSAIIVLLVFVLLSRCGNQAMRTRKVPQEHDERMG